jgi:hypothetical protein
MEINKIPLYFEDEVDTRKKSKEALVKIFESKLLNIDTITSIIAEFHKYENQNSIEVFNSIERNINESEVSNKKIDDINRNMTQLDERIQKIFKEWQKITGPINYYSKNLENLMISKKNVAIIVHSLNIYINIKDQVDQLKQLLESNDNNIVIVFKQIRYLTYLRRVLLDKVKTVIRSEKIEKFNNLADHLLCVQHFEDEFFIKFWKYFEHTLEYANKRPEFLVKLLRIIEEDPDYTRNIKAQFQIYNVKFNLPFRKTMRNFKG